MEKESGKILYEKKLTIKTSPASLTKIMTVLVALEKIQNLSDEVVIDSESYQQVFVENGSMAGFVPGEKVTYRDLLYGTILSSGGEAANSLAGDTDLYVKWMNEKAKQLNLNQTHFTNVEGLDNSNQYTTAQ